MTQERAKNEISAADVEKLRRFLKKGIVISRRKNMQVEAEKIILSTEECDELLARHCAGLWIRFRHIIDPTIPKVEKDDKAYKYVKRAEEALNDIRKAHQEKKKLETEMHLRREQIAAAIVKKKMAAERELIMAQKQSRKPLIKPAAQPRQRSVQRNVLSTPLVTTRRVSNAYDMGSPESVRKDGVAQRKEIDDLFG